MFIKSPFNYIGNKFKLLNRIIPLFPSKIDNFVDLFAGGGDIFINVNANYKYANDINYMLIDIFKEFQKLGVDDTVKYIENRINEFKLSKSNIENFNKFRTFYNQSKKYPLDLYVLILHSFNYQIRFNSNMDYNNPFGLNKSSFNDSIKNNLIQMIPKLDNIKFSSVNFSEYDLSFLSENDFVYCDPPYLITVGSYNDGNRGFPCWKSDDDLKLFEILDYLDSKNVKFALSNVLESKGIRNENLIKFSDKYNTHHLNFNYSNSSYHKKDRISKNDEVLITNYENYLDW